MARGVAWVLEEEGGVGVVVSWPDAFNLLPGIKFDEPPKICL